DDVVQRAGAEAVGERAAGGEPLLRRRAEQVAAAVLRRGHAVPLPSPDPAGAPSSPSRRRSRPSSVIVLYSRTWFRRPGRRSSVECATSEPIATPKQTVPGGRPSWGSGPATPVVARPTSAPSRSRTPLAMASAASSETTGPSGTANRSCFTSEA